MKLQDYEKVFYKLKSPKAKKEKPLFPVTYLNNIWVGS